MHLEKKHEYSLCMFFLVFPVKMYSSNGQSETDWLWFRFLSLSSGELRKQALGGCDVKSWIALVVCAGKCDQKVLL